MATVTPSTHFAPKTKVSAYIRVNDVTPTPNANPAKSVQAGSDGKATFTGLKDGVQYFIGWDEDGDWRTIAVQAKSDEYLREHGDLRTLPETVVRKNLADRQAQAEAIEADRKKNPLAGSPAPGRTVESNQSKDKRRIVGEPQPGPHQRDVQGVAQRSDTIDGEATPKDPKEHVPDVPQEELAKNTPQRSNTETGVATVKDVGETVPAAKQEDVPKSTPQRSSTESGQAERKPPVKGAEVAKRDDSSANRARGRTQAKAEENVKAKAPVKATTRTGTPKRKAAKKK